VGLSAIVVQVTAPFVVDTVESETAPIVTGVDGIPTASWDKNGVMQCLLRFVNLLGIDGDALRGLLSVTIQVPDVLPCMSDTRWLQGQHLLVTLRSKGSQVLCVHMCCGGW
jgi:hypothetical protein